MDRDSILGCEPCGNLMEWHGRPAAAQFQDLRFVGDKAGLPGTAMGAGIFHVLERFLSFLEDMDKQLVNFIHFMILFDHFGSDGPSRGVLRKFSERRMRSCGISEHFAARFSPDNES